MQRKTRLAKIKLILNLDNILNCLLHIKIMNKWGLSGVVEKMLLIW